MLQDICQNITVGTVDELEGNKNVLDVQIHYFEEESTLNSDIVPDSDSESDEFDYQPDSSNSDKTFFQDYHNIFFRKTEKNPIGKNGQLKKMDRVFNTRHACLFCGKLFAKVHDHIMQKHHDEAEVQLLPSINNPDKEKRRRMLTLLRNKGDHKHNKRVMEAKQGELILARRPAGVKSIRTDQFKPCPSCFMWVSDVAKHRSHSNRCVEKNEKISKRQLMVACEATSGTYGHVPSLLQSEVFSKMCLTDTITQIAVNDQLILELGNACIQKNSRNKLRRGQYASNKMRLSARLLNVLMGEGKRTMSECLVPAMYKKVVAAVIKISGGSVDTFAHPSNALKMGYYLKEMADIKYSQALIKQEEEKAKDAQAFRFLCEKNWSTDVSSLACATIAERKFNQVIELPLPSDLKSLSTYLQKEANSIKSVYDDTSYRHAVCIAQARLVTYNKRRPGELEAVRCAVNHSSLSKDPLCFVC